MYIWWAFANLSVQLLSPFLLGNPNLFVCLFVCLYGYSPFSDTSHTLHSASHWVNLKRPFIIFWTLWLEKARENLLWDLGKKLPHFFERAIKKTISLCPGCEWDRMWLLETARHPFLTLMSISLKQKRGMVRLLNFWIKPHPIPPWPLFT